MALTVALIVFLVGCGHQGSIYPNLSRLWPIWGSHGLGATLGSTPWRPPRSPPQIWKARRSVSSLSWHTLIKKYKQLCIYTGAGHIIRISSKSWFISLIPFKKWNLYNVYIHSTQTDIFQVFISFNFDDYKRQLMKTPNSVSHKIRILWKGSILKTPGATI